MQQDICVVVPTIREYECMRAYFENARDHGFDLDRLFVVLVTEDVCDVEAMERMLAEEGVDPVEPSPGAEVDPVRHEVLMREPSDHPEGTVVRCYRPGYVMAGKVVQTAQVTVSEGDDDDA